MPGTTTTTMTIDELKNWGKMRSVTDPNQSWIESAFLKTSIVRSH